MSETADPEVLDALRQVIDPELGVNVVDLGLVVRAERDGARVRVELGMTSPTCPLGPQMRADAERAIRLRLPGLTGVEVETARHFRWSQGRLSPAARERLGMAEGTSADKRVAPRLFWGRLPLLALAMISLLVGLWAGLLRLGWHWPIARDGWIVLHGPLMASAFLGTLICLERAVGLEKRLAYLAPACSAIAALGLLVGLPDPFPAAFALAASIGLTLLFLLVLWEDSELATLTLALGAACWGGGNLLWVLGWPFPRIVIWWEAFLVLTIAGERLELSRFRSPAAWARLAFVVPVALMLVGASLSPLYPEQGPRLSSAAMILLAAWLLRFDVATETVRQQGLARFIAVCLLAGYGWLAVGGVLGVLEGAFEPGPPYDARLHAVFLGFVFSMIFGHAPIIFPAVLGRRIRFGRAFYLHLALLHASLVLRVSGDLTGWWAARLWGGLLGAGAILFFVFNTVRSIEPGGGGPEAESAPKPKSMTEPGGTWRASV